MKPNPRLLQLVAEIMRYDVIAAIVVKKEGFEHVCQTLEHAQATIVSATHREKGLL